MSRILMLSYHTCPLASQEGKETGGMNVYVLELAKALGAQGHTVDIVTRCQAKSNLYLVQITKNVRLFHLAGGPAKTLSKTEMMLYISEFSNHVENFLAAERLKYDVIHAHYYMSGMVGQQLNQKLENPLPLIMTFHTLALMKNLVGRSASEKEDFIRIEAELELVKKVDNIISPTSIEKEYLHYLYDADVTKIHIISPGVNLENFRDIDQAVAKHKIGAEAAHKILLFVGRIEPLKGIDVLLYALKIMKKRNPDLKICLWIVGGDVSQPVSEWSEELQRLEQLQRELGLETSVIFEGQQPQERLLWYYNAADLLVMPSHYEAFGMVALESMACGTPFITTNVTGVSTLIDKEHEEIVSTVNNPLQLASQIEYVLLEPKAYHHIQQSLLKKAQSLSWAKIAEQIALVYHSNTRF